ncbi:MAG: hypothetical protein N0E55_06585 [Candidatus Thiodiazotropha taylori]|nr:hypothetical protein [Candidatus Thiodiazotropha taylori]MCG8108107.1 hypothetical protein [Candidatus Thiodiazotropha taylori]MCG8110135.1 hypothetical protein [Candidatus Thiodiazotropha taylori]MCW4252357.1 hypothetical protein [Candidatus Thiodiazotropha taylori]MCW4280446.1 hypothetical protein [Candidatus Thiodiazotropha taylori]
MKLAVLGGKSVSDLKSKSPSARIAEVGDHDYNGDDSLRDEVIRNIIPVSIQLLFRHDSGMKVRIVYLGGDIPNLFIRR